MQDKITIADAPECLNTNDKAMWVLGYQAALAARSTCLHQIQEPAAAEQAAWHAGLDEGRAQEAPAAVAVQLDANGIAPCPLCGSESKHVKAGVGGHRILCWNDDCECSSGYFCSKEEAITSWNDRAVLAATPAADEQGLDFVISPAALRVDDLILVPRGLLGSACHAINKKRDAPKTLAELRRYSFSYLPSSAAAPVVPDGWVPCVVTYEGQHPEEVAYGPQIMMDRLKKWLERYFEMKAAAPVVLPEPDAVISEVMGLVDEWGMESHLRGAAELDAQHSEATQEEIDCAKDRASKERAAWKAIESKLRALLATATGLPAQAEDIADLVTGMSVSVDVSTGDDDAGNRYFGTVTLAQEDNEGKHGLTLLAQDAEPNFTPQAQADARDADVLAWLLPNLHPANFGLEYDGDKLDADWNAEFKRAILAAADESAAIAAAKGE